MSALVDFLVGVSENGQLKEDLREADTAEDFAAVASRAGFDFNPIDLVDSFCAELSRGSDDERLELFNACSWDFGELAWLLRKLVDRQQQAG